MRGAGCSSPLATLTLTLVACGPPPPEEPVENPRATAIEALKSDPEVCPFDRAEYCLEDLVEPAIDATLDSVQFKKLEGKLPETDRKLARFVDAAKRRYRQMHLDEEPRREAVLAKMKARYDAPPITREGAQVYADLGVLPTGFQKALRGGGYVLATTDSPLLDGFSWSGEAIAAKFLQLRKAEPGADRYTVRIVVPKGTSTAELVMAWDPAEQQIAYTDFMSDWATREPVGANLERVASGKVSVFKGLLSCTPGDGGDTQEGCPRVATFPTAKDG